MSSYLYQKESVHLLSVISWPKIIVLEKHIISLDGKILLHAIKKLLRQIAIDSCSSHSQLSDIVCMKIIWGRPLLLTVPNRYKSCSCPVYSHAPTNYASLIHKSDTP
ncbi:unnamed protein product [Heterobilharzia americana]|nr:unnamed protein product [Heterobilharzia americana]